VEEAEGNVAIRLAIGPSPRRIELPAGYEPTAGWGVVLREGEEAVLIAYGPVMLHEALVAAERLSSDGIALRVVNMPWLNRVDPDWLDVEIAHYQHVFVLEDHAPVGALGDALRRDLGGRQVTVYGIEGWPACGTPEEALRFHQLDGASIAGRIAAQLDVRA
ncbi:MAG: 1-deoxy-D-xylulose-5-phosphate synthase, partial [Actinobacteria bacterium]|nr:1-deoxy-D-xylulose-5-phosphate synthase [Actinomycetota bacterium]